MIWLNVGSGTHNAPAPWVNADVVDDKPDIHPDLLVKPGEPLPFDDASVERVFASHVLEHIAWPEVLAFLGDVRRVLAPGGELMVVGPDVYRSIKLWHDGTWMPWELLVDVLEHADANGYMNYEWPNARHQWNCHEERVVTVLGIAGFAKIEAQDPNQPIDDWPLVGWAPWQCAVRAVA